ncbi:MAG: Eco57I restriction-modification methylase domain-containing protein [Janthinobacterium lividum]
MLGLIFEKINGYRDGSFYTPGFVTMYMCRHTLRRAVVQHFNRAYGWQAHTLGDLRDYVQEQPPQARAGLAAHFATLRVCDPAVGSGHFLVSALNELLVIKSELRLIRDAAGALPYRLSIDRDELVVQDDDNHLVAYRATYDPATGQRTVGAGFTRLQQALFREKRQLLEHTLFGVDLNPNSVRICRLRLWIELLKHAYYRPEGGFQDLEVLPNLDLNIQPGNSLLARFPLSEDLGDVFKDPRYALASYQDAVAAYFNATGHAAKSELQTFLAGLKQHFRAAFSLRDPLAKRIAAVREELRRVEFDAQPDLFGKTRLSEDDAWAKATVLRKRLEPLEAERLDREQGTLFRDAFEWRFEFPEILHPDGSFRGFDVVIGNPPYIRQEELAGPFKRHLQQHFVTSDSKADLYVYFIELGLGLLAPGGELSFITSNKWLSTGFGAPLRRWLPAHHTLLEYVDFGDLYVFPQTKAYPAILTVQRTAPAADSHFRAALIPDLPPPALEQLVATHARTVAQSSLQETGWTLSDAPGQLRLDSLKAAGTPLGEYVGNKMYRGILTGLNPAFVITAETKARLIAGDARSAEIIKPFLAGRDLKRYRQPQPESYLLLLPNGWTRQQLGWTKNKRGSYSVPPVQPNFATPWEALVANYPAVANYLLPFETAASARSDKGNYWWELRACDYYPLFAGDKIMWKEIATYQEFTLDTGGNYANNKTFFIPSHDLFLLGVLNSAPAFFFLQQVTTKMKDNAMAMQIPQVSQLPIPPATPAEQATIAGWVQQILADKAADPAADTLALEQQIDAEVARLFGVAA